MIPLDSNTARMLIIHPNDPSLRNYMKDLVSMTDVWFINFAQSDITFDNLTMLLPYAESQNNTISPSIIILDECDRLPSQILAQILQLLSTTSAEKIIIFSRELLHNSIDDESLLTQMQIHTGMSGSYADIHGNSQTLEVFGFGTGIVRLNGVDIDLIASDLLHEFFFYLLEHPISHRDDVIAHFWQDFPSSDAVANFHITRQRLHKLLGVKLSILRGSQYSLNPDIDIHYDVNLFRDYIKPADSDNQQEQQSIYQSAFALCRYDFLSQSPSAWVQHTRHNLQLQIADVCSKLAKMSPNADQALGYYSHAIRYNPTRDDSVLDMMTLYLNMGQPCDAMTVYDFHAQHLQSQLNIKPASNIKHIMQQAESLCAERQKETF